MAGSNTHPDEGINGINVTPLVDVVLVLLVVLMVTATYIAAKAIPVDLPRGATGEALEAPLAIGIDTGGKLFLDGQAATETELVKRIRTEQTKRKDVRAVIAADGAVAHREVVHVIDLLRQENVVRFAINVNPRELDAPPRR